MPEWEFNATFRYLQLQRNSGNFCSICQELPGTDIFIMEKSAWNVCDIGLYETRTTTFSLYPLSVSEQRLTKSIFHLETPVRYKYYLLTNANTCFKQYSNFKIIKIKLFKIIHAMQKKHTLSQIAPHNREQLRNFGIVIMKYAARNVLLYDCKIRNKIYLLIRRERGDENSLKFRKI